MSRQTEEHSDSQGTLDVPVYEMLGGKVRDQVRVYANGWSYRSNKPSEFAREAERVVKDGYTAMKLYPLATPMMDSHGHIRHVSQRFIDRAAEDLAIARVKAVRDAVGLDFREGFPEPIAYDALRQLLVYRGLMTHDSYTYLRLLSVDAAYLAALDHLRETTCRL